MAWSLKRWAGRASIGYLMLVFLSACSNSGGLRSASEAVSSSAAENPARARAKAHTELASQYFQAKNMAVALEEVAIAINSDPDYAPVYNIRGLIQMYLKENEAANENFQKALSLAPGDVHETRVVRHSAHRSIHRRS